MKRISFTTSMVMLLVIWLYCGVGVAAGLNSNPPASPVKLIFIHHSCGENWLTDGNGGLGIALKNNNYFVSDTNYGWGSTGIGELTDIGHWWDWFRGPTSGTYMAELYDESRQAGDYFSRLSTDPGGENSIIMFKSCFPNSEMGGNSSDPPTTGDNPLRGEDCWSDYMTVANAKGIYNDILEYFATRRDKLFIAVTAPPQVAGDTDATHAANARAFNNWLVNDWLKDYAYHNVAVFDFYNVLTSNGGNTGTSDLGSATGNHHRWWGGAVQHLQTVSGNTAAYATAADDSHPTSAGNQKATAEFVPLLNVYYHAWHDADGGGGTTANAAPEQALDAVSFPGVTVNPEDTTVQVGACAGVLLQPSLAVPAADRGKTAQLIMYLYLPDGGFGITVPSAGSTTLTAETKFNLLPNAIDFTGIPGMNFYVYYGYALGASIKYSAYSVVVQSTCPGS